MADLQWVFVHGAGGSGDFWELVRPAFPAAWMVDLPGHAAGRARRAGVAPARPFAGPPIQSIEAYADWVMAEIAGRDWPAVVLVGHSMGGAIAQVVGLRRPVWLRGLVLSSTAARIAVSPERLRLAETDPPAAVDSLLDHGFAVPPGGYRREGIRRQLLRIPPAVLRGDYLACNAFDLTAQVRAGALLGPAVVLAGYADRVIPPAQSADLATHIPYAAFGMIAGAGHMIPLEQPAAWGETVWRLWAEVTATNPAPVGE